MKKLYLAFILQTFVLFSLFGQSRLYQPSSEEERQFYINIDKDIWPDDVRQNVDQYKDVLIGWVGIIENVAVDFNNDEYYILGINIKHYYYDWVEDFGVGNKPIKLSSEGEGYFYCNYYMKRNWEENVIQILAENIIGQCAIVYGFPTGIMENGIVNVTVKHLRAIDEQFIDMNWMKYGRNY
jgi:hypothetical protein